MSMSGQLLIKKRAVETLDEFVVAIDKIIGPVKWEEHDSANYVDERYFCGSALALEVDVAISDDAEFSDYHFWISISPSVANIRERDFLNGVADAVARALCLGGYEVFRPKDFARPGNSGFVYHLSPDISLWSGERVRVESV